MANRANITICEAQMGAGKTCTSTAILVDDYFAHIYAIESPEGYVFPVEPYKRDIVKLLPLPDSPDQEPKLIQIPPDYTPKSTVRIFANYHLFGIEYVYCPPELMLRLINTGVISEGKLVIDEAYLTGEARRGQNTLELILTWFVQQMRKRRVELYLLVQNRRFIDWRYRYVAKRIILCRYNEKTKMIRLLVQELDKGTEHMLRYYAPYYWKYFDTNEIPAMPEFMVRKAGTEASQKNIESNIEKLEEMRRKDLVAGGAS